MTAQEIQKFVSQPTPRKVPKNVLRAAVKRVEVSMRDSYFLSVFCFVLSSTTIRYLQITRFINVFLLFLLVSFLEYGCYYWYFRKRLIRLLSEGRFATGRIVERGSMFKVFFYGEIQFSDQNSAVRTDKVVRRDARIAVCRQWAAEQRPVGLLYLPDRKDIVITDLWLE